jgi:hypothetical protein
MIHLSAAILKPGIRSEREFSNPRIGDPVPVLRSEKATPGLGVAFFLF